MTQFYSDASRESAPTSLPDCETVYCSPRYCEQYSQDNPGDTLEPGWYFWFCFPGCLPDSDLIGPYASEREAIEAARNDFA